MKEFLSLDPSVFMPIIILVIGIIIKMPIKKVIKSALTMGIAFVAMSMVLSFLFDTIDPVSRDFVNNTNINLSTIDVGWIPASALSLTWKYAIFMFPLQIIINIFLIYIKATNVLNVDILNIWGKIFTAILVYNTTNSISLAFIASIIQIIIELKIGEMSQKRIESISKISNVTCSHCMLFQMSFMYPFVLILDKINFINSNVDTDKIKKKIGIFGEESVMGFIIGMFLCLLASYNLKDSIQVSMKLATALVLLPMIANLFTDALNPLAKSIENYMKEKYSSREIYISLDWTFLAGQAEIWIVSILLIPITLLMAVIFSKLGLSNVLPLAGIVNIVVVVPALIITNKNIIKMFILSCIFTPTYLIISSIFSDIITKESNLMQSITYYCIEAPIFRWSIANIFKFNIIAIIFFILFIVFLRYLNLYLKNKPKL